MIPDNQTIVLKRVTARDKYKEPSAYKEMVLSARVVNETTKTTNPAGNEVVTTMTVLIKTPELKREAISVQYDDRFSFTDEFGNEVVNRVPQNIAPARGFSGTSPFVRVFI